MIYKKYNFMCNGFERHNSEKIKIKEEFEKIKFENNLGGEKRKGQLAAAR